MGVILCSHFLARMVSNMVALQFEDEGKGLGALKKKADRAETQTRKLVLGPEELQPILERNIFDSKAVSLAPALEGEKEEPSDEPVIQTGEAVPTSLGIKLVSTFAVGEGKDARSSCVISGGSGGKGSEAVYTVNDKELFAPDTNMVRILFNRVEFTNKGRLEYVELEDFAKGVNLNVPPSDAGVPPSINPQEPKDETRIEKSAEGKFAIDRAEIDDAIANLDKLYTQVRAVPHFKDGKSNGLKLLSVRAGSVFSKLGLKRGDILQKINGVELDIKKGLEIFNQLKTENHVTMEIERRGKVETQEYDIR